MSTAAFATLGNVTIDDLVFDDGSTIWRSPGGNAIWSGLGIAVWGPRPTVIAPIGRDYPTELLGDRIDISRCPVIAETLRDWGLYEADGARTFVFRKNVRDWHDYSPTIADLDGLEADNIHIAPLPLTLQIDMARTLRGRGCQAISVDIDDRFISADTDEFAALMTLVDLFLPSRQDAEALLPGQTPPQALRSLRQIGPQTPVIAIKLGADGVILHERGATRYLHIPTIAEAAVDITGAGDAFSGGALYGFCSAGTAQDAGIRGSVSASYAVSTNGPGGLVAATGEVAEERAERLRARVVAHPL